MRIETLADLQLLRSAIRRGWPVPAHVRRDLMRQVAALLGSACPPRWTVAVARVVLAADRANLDAERTRRPGMGPAE